MAALRRSKKPKIPEHLVPQDRDWPRGTIFTVGHSTLPLEDFIALLKTYGILCLADIRTVPRSRHNPQFNADTLGAALRRHKIDYVPLRSLGGLRHARKDSPNTGWRNESFRGYADYMQTEEFVAGIEDLTQISREARTAIMCAEAVWWRCHRRIIADYLIARGEIVLHIMAPGHVEPATLTAGAVVRADGTIVYPPEQRSLLN